MRTIVPAGILSAILTFVTAFALRAADPALTVAAIALVVVLFTWFAALHSTEFESGLALVNPASALALAIAGRRAWGSLLPLATAQVVGAVLAGLGALALEDRLGPTLTYAEPTLVVAGIGAVVVGLVGTWATFAIDGEASEAFSAIPVALAGAALPVGLTAVFNPAVVVGVATAGLLTWDLAGVAALGVLAGALAGAYATNLLLPEE